MPVLGANFLKRANNLLHVGFRQASDKLHAGNVRRCVLRRLYSTFTGGWPGVGLLLMRLVVGLALIVPLGLRLFSEPAMFETVGAVLFLTAGVLLIVGLWTPIAGTSVALVEIGKMFVVQGDRPVWILLATLGAALAMLGPGLWSLDARLYGWKRIETTSSRKKNWSL